MFENTISSRRDLSAGHLPDRLTEQEHQHQQSSQVVIIVVGVNTVEEGWGGACSWRDGDQFFITMML